MTSSPTTLQVTGKTQMVFRPQIYSKESIAAIAWAVYHQAMFFAQGEMVGKTPLTNEWVQMTNAVKGGGDPWKTIPSPLQWQTEHPPHHHS